MALPKMRILRVLADMTLFEAAQEYNRRRRNFDRRLDESELSRIERGQRPCPDSMRRHLAAIYAERSESPPGEAAR